MRVFLAFVAAPLLPAGVPAWFAYINGNAYHPLSLFIFFCLILYALQILVGIPTYKILKRRKSQQVWSYLIIGSLSTAMPFLLLCIYRWTEENRYEVSALIGPVSFFAFLGAATGFMFWLIARPDRVQKLDANI